MVTYHPQVTYIHNIHTSILSMATYYTQADSDRTRGNSFELKERGFRLNVRKKFFALSVIRHRLPREAVDAPSLEVFKARLDGAFRNLV